MKEKEVAEEKCKNSRGAAGGAGGAGEGGEVHSY